MGRMKRKLGDQPYDLFNQPEKPKPADNFDAKASAKAKEEGIERAAKGAPTEWKLKMMECVTEVARRRFHFTSDHVFELADVLKIQHPPERRAFGHIMRAAAKAGICKLADKMPEKSNRVSLHRSPIAVWESLIFRAEDAA